MQPPAPPNSREEHRRERSRRRAEVLSEYKRLRKSLHSVNRNEDQNKIQTLIGDQMGRIDELYSIVKKKLDGTAADSKHFCELLSLCHEASKRINTTTKPFELKRTIRSLKRQASEDSGNSNEVRLNKLEFSRYVKDKYVNTFLRATPTFEFFYGALRAEDLITPERKQRRVREKLVEAKTVRAKEKDIEVDVDQDTTPKEVEHIHEQIKKLAASKPVDQEGLPFFETLVDPKSFTQTVENIFHASFLVKEGQIGIRRDKSSRRPILTVENGNARGAQEEGRRAQGSATAAANQTGAQNQSILSFTMEDYKAWLSEFNIRRRAFVPRSTEQAQTSSQANG